MEVGASRWKSLEVHHPRTVTVLYVQEIPGTIPGTQQHSCEGKEGEAI
jgi:hypothetical protein